MKTFAIFLILFQFIGFAQVTVQQAYPNLTFSSPVDIQNCGDNRLFVVERAGKIKVFQNISSVTSAITYLDITDRVSSGGEMGLLGLAFHPNYFQNGYIYVNYTVSSPTRATRISRFNVTSNPDSADKNSELILMTFNQPYSNHNGGQLAFGPDAYLYIATGDGGSGGDPQNNSQNKSVLLGKILRIDVDTTAGGLQYGIPPDNPFANNTQGWSKEIFTYGMRNPWRFSFDYETGKIWCADVGQSAREEIDILVNGGNYGWRCYEGNLAYNTSGCGPSTDYIFPIFDYPRSEGYSVTGGFVYRGPGVPELWGKYIYGDYGSKHIWSLVYDGVNPVVNTKIVNNSGIAISTFGIDWNNELYIADLNSGKIWKFTPTATIQAPTNLTLTFFFGGNGIGLNWVDNATNETGYKVERRITGGIFQEIATLGVDAVSYADSSALPNINYEYRVRAFNGSTFSGYSNLASGYFVPVELNSFTAMVHNNSVQLNWQTASELNNHGFEILRSTQNDVWNTIAFIKGKGTITEASDYSFDDDISELLSDSKSKSLSIKYRLNQIDLDGKENLLDFIEVEINKLPGQFTLEQNYPNPFNPSTNISFGLMIDSYVTLKVFDILGREVATLVNEELSAGEYTVELNINNELRTKNYQLTTSIYFYRLTARNFTATKKLMFLK